MPYDDRGKTIRNLRVRFENGLEHMLRSLCAHTRE